MTVAPIITTPRLTLRALSEADFEPLCAFYASDRSRFVGGPMGREQVWRALACEAGHWSLKGYGRWSVVERESNTIAGLIGLWCPEGWLEPEIGWDLYDGFGGKGYATEAGQAARTYAYDVLNWHTAISLVAPENEPSRRVAKRLGAKHDGDFTHERFGLLQVWRHPAPDELVNGGMEAYA